MIKIFGIHVSVQPTTHMLCNDPTMTTISRPLICCVSQNIRFCDKSFCGLRDFFVTPSEKGRSALPLGVVDPWVWTGITRFCMSDVAGSMGANREANWRILRDPQRVVRVRKTG